MKNSILLSLLFLLISSAVLAQTQCRISGRIIDQSTGEPLAFAYVMLEKDSKFITGGISSDDGSFQLVTAENDSLTFIVRFIGYETLTQILNIAGNRTLNLGDINLVPSAEEITTVTVTGILEQRTESLETKTYRIEDNIASTGGTILDMLQTIPGVNVDTEGNVKLRGSNKIGFYIDNKPSALLGTGRTASLKQIPASSIEKIEVITNPSARYDPDGMAGIINIIFKEEKREGLNGEAGFTFGWNDIFLPSLSVNYRKKNINLFVNFDGIWKEFQNHNRLTERTDNQSGEIQRQWYNTMEPVDAKIYRAGVDYFFGRNQNNQFTFYWQYEDEYEENNGYVKHRDYSAAGEWQSGKLRNLREIEYNDVMDFALQYKRLFNTTGKEINSGIIYSSAHEQEIYYFDENTLDQNDNIISEGVLNEKTDLDNFNSTWNIYADYVQPFNDEGKLETGYKSIIRKIDLDHLWYDLSTGNELLLPGRNYRYIYHEQIHSLYGVVSDALDKVNYELGLRLEQVFTRSEEDSTKYSFDNNYFRIYPSVKAGYVFTGSHQLLFSYSGRVNRPDFEQLNLIPKFVDPLNLEAGNPELDPEYVHSFELGYKKQWESVYIQVAGFYRSIRKPIFETITVDTAGVATYTPQNFDKGFNGGAEMLSSFDLFKWWEINGSFTWFRNSVAASEKFGTSRRSDYSWNAKLSSRNNFGSGWQFQLDGWYNAPLVTPQGKILEEYSMDAALSKTFMKGKCEASLRVTDVFNTLERKEEFTADDYHIIFTDDHETRFFYAGIKYKF